MADYKCLNVDEIYYVFFISGFWVFANHPTEQSGTADMENVHLFTRAGFLIFVFTQKRVNYGKN